MRPKKPYDQKKRRVRSRMKRAAEKYQEEAKAMVLEMKWTAQDYLDALDMLERVTKRIFDQYHVTMTRPEAEAHFNAGALVLKHRLMTCNEMEGIFCGKQTPQR